MSLSVYAIVLFAAALHAGWNAVVKLGGDKTIATVLVTSSAAGIALLALPFARAPAAASWPYIAASGLIHVVYFLLVARTYRVGDMGQTYPLMRGIAPLIVAVIGVALLGETLSDGAIAGIVLICCGVTGMALGSGREQARGIALAVTNAAVIASYTLVDGIGARLSHAPLGYTLWVFILTALVPGLWLATGGRARLAAMAQAALWRPLIGGAATLVSYALVLWAMTQASIPVVAALRETAILFGAAISVLVLKENPKPIRAAAAGLIAAGAVVIRGR